MPSPCPLISAPLYLALLGTCRKTTFALFWFSMGLESYECSVYLATIAPCQQSKIQANRHVFFLEIKDNTLDEIDKTSHLDNQFDFVFHTLRYGLGVLERLPLEIVHLALIQLDIRSLTDFRRVNKRARLVANSIPQYRHILVHAPALIRGSLNIEAARFFSCQDLYEKLSTAECDSCGDFAGYLYLITCRRVCFLCFTEKPDYLPLSQNDIIRKFGLDSAHIAGLPRVKSFPGRYSPRGIKCRKRETLFDYSIARQAGTAVHGTIEKKITWWDLSYMSFSPRKSTP